MKDDKRLFNNTPREYNLSLSVNKVNEGKTFAFITLLRGVTVLLIAWDHMVGAWLDWSKVVWMPLEFVRQYITRPLGIIQDFGAIGVSFLFLMSGFLITHIGQTENRKEFSIKRLLRIYPPLIVSIILILAFYWIYAIITQSHTYVQDFNLQAILLGASLLNYFFWPQNVLNGIAWILVVEGLFYIACFILLPFLKTRPQTSVALLLAFTGFVIVFSRELGISFLLFASSVAYFPFIIMGQILFYFWKRRITRVGFAFFSATAMLLFVLGVMMVNTDFLPINNSYIISFVYAYVIFGVSLLLAKRIKVGRFLGFFSKISYSFYLNQTYCYLWFVVLLPILGVEFSIGTIFVLLTFIAYLSWRFVENPSRKLARRILGPVRSPDDANAKGQIHP